MLATTGSKTMGFSEVSTLLWRERDALQLLLFKLVEEQLIVSAGQTRWLAQANDEIEAGPRPAARHRGAAGGRGGRHRRRTRAARSHPRSPNWQALAPEPWATLFAEHRQVLLQLVDEVERATGDNRALLAAGARAVRQTLLSVNQTVQTYDSHGSAAAMPNGPMLMDEQA